VTVAHALSQHAHDFIHAIRTLAKARAFTAVCVTSLGLGMGTVIAILLLMRALVGTPPGVNDDGLVEVVIRPLGALREQAGSAIVDTWSYPDYLDVRDAVSGMTMTGWSFGDGVLRLADQGGAIPLPTMYVSSNYFSTVDVTLARGHGFAPTHDASLAEREVVVGYRRWQTRLGADPGIIGRTITVNLTAHVVVGVAPDGYRSHLSPETSGSIQLWMPLSRHPRLPTDRGLPRCRALGAGHRRTTGPAGIGPITARTKERM